MPILTKLPLLGALLLCLSTQAAAQSIGDCTRPDNIDVSNLDGNTITESELATAQGQVGEYAQVAQEYLQCIYQVGQEAAAEDQEQLVELYNTMVAELQQNVDTFNTAVRTYRARMEQAAGESE